MSANIEIVETLDKGVTLTTIAGAEGNLVATIIAQARAAKGVTVETTALTTDAELDAIERKQLPARA